MNILFVCPYTPTRIRTRSLNLLRALVQRGHRVTLATLWENEQELGALDEWRAQNVSIIAARLTKPQVGMNAARALASGKPLQSLYCWQPALMRQLIERANAPIDFIHVEHLRGAEYGLRLRRAKPSIPIVWDSVDCISYLFEQAAQSSRSLFGKWITRFELGRTRRREDWLVKQFNRTLVTSELDKRAFMQLEPHADLSTISERIQVLRNGVDLEYFAPRGAPRDTPTIIFTGKLSYHANITAAMYLIDQIMPRVWQTVPAARAQIVGYKPPRQLLDLQTKNPARVSVIGTVPDLRPYLSQASVAVAPMLYGAGIQNKVLEAMAMATPVVAMPQAVAALSVCAESDLLIGQSPDELAHQIVRVLTDPNLAERLGRAGRRYVESNHDWNRIAAQLESIYLQASAVN